MSKKRLQSIANTMCHLFCGWRLNTSNPKLVELGSGRLELDALTGQCVFQSKPTSSLTIAQEVRAWLQPELATNKIPMATVSRAQLAVDLSFDIVPWSEPEKEIFYSNGEVVRTAKMNRCTMECVSVVKTKEATYQSKLTEVQQWPLNWPTSAQQSSNYV
jgi:hypothetical protein